MVMAFPFAAKSGFSRGLTTIGWIFPTSVNVSQLIMEHIAPVLMQNWVRGPLFLFESPTLYWDISSKKCWPGNPAGVCEECYWTRHFFGSETRLVQKIARLQCVIQWNHLVRSCFKANSSRMTVTPTTIAVCNVWTITTTFLCVRAIVGDWSVVIWRFWPIRVILRVGHFWLRGVTFLR